MTFNDRIARFLHSPRCPFCCRRVSENTVMCRSCRNEIAYRPVTRITENIPYVDGCFSPFYYDGKIQSAIIRYKFCDKNAYATAFARLLADFISEKTDISYDMVTWVPLNKNALRKRGYDQSWLLAKATAEALDAPFKSTLTKTRGVKPQRSISAYSRRFANVLGAFKCTNPEVNGKRILLIDDICTSGATLGECAKMLKIAGADTVFGVTFAKTRLLKKNS